MRSGTRIPSRAEPSRITTWSAACSPMNRRVSRCSCSPATEIGVTGPSADSSGSPRYGLDEMSPSRIASTLGSMSPCRTGPGRGNAPLRYIIPTPQRVYAGSWIRAATSSLAEDEMNRG
jgi:hypothetical protein